MHNHSIPTPPHINVQAPTTEDIELVLHWRKQGVTSPSVPVGFVYLMQHGDLHKIGMSLDPSKRIRTIKRIYKNVPLKLVEAVQVIYPGSLETGLYYHYGIVHETGEWFRLTPAMANEIRRLMWVWQRTPGGWT